MLGRPRRSPKRASITLALALLAAGAISTPALAQRGGTRTGPAMVPTQGINASPGYRGYNPLTSNPISGVGGGINPFYRGYNPIAYNPINGLNRYQYGTVYNGYNPLLSGGYGSYNNLGNPMGMIGGDNFAA